MRFAQPFWKYLILLVMVVIMACGFASKSGGPLFWAAVILLPIYSIIVPGMVLARVLLTFFDSRRKREP